MTGEGSLFQDNRAELIGAGTGAAAGAAAAVSLGSAAGFIAGPLDALAGAGIGAVIGSLIGGSAGGWIGRAIRIGTTAQLCAVQTANSKPLKITVLRKRLFMMCAS